MQELADAIDGDDPRALLAFVGSLDAKGHKAAAKWLAADWKAKVHEMSALGGRFAPARYARWAQLMVGMTAAADTPAQALSLPYPNPMHDFGIAWRPKAGLDRLPATARAALAQAAINRGADWCSGYLAALADAKKPRPMHVDVTLAIAHAHGLALPDTAIVAETWAQRFGAMLPVCVGPNRDEPYRYDQGSLALARDGERWVVSALEAVAHDPVEAMMAGHAGMLVGDMLLSTFDHRDTVAMLSGLYGEAEPTANAVGAVTRLVERGAVDAAELARRAIAALSRGDSTRAQRLQVRLLVVAAPATALVHEQARVLANLLASGTGTAATAAQQLLTDADAATPLADDLFVDACQIVFARKEKGLRASQLAWAKRRGAVDGRAAAAVLGLCEALSCDDHALQRDAARAIESAWPWLAPEAREAAIAQVEARRGILDEALFQRLWAACTGAPAEAAAPMPAPPRPAPPRPGMSVQPFERVADPARLPAEVELALRTYALAREAYAVERAIGAAMDALNAGVPALAQRIVDRIGNEKPFWMKVLGKRYEGREPSHLAWARIEELRAAVARGTPQVFLSLPDFAHGAIAAATLVERLEQLARSGGSALPADFVVALLRTRACDASQLAALRALDTPEGGAAAAFVEAGGSRQQKTSLRTLSPAATDPGHRGEQAKWASTERAEVCVALSPATTAPVFEGVPGHWALGFEPANAPQASEFDMAADWITTMLPDNAEALAASHLWGFRRAGLDHGTDGGKNVALRLPLFLDAHGPAGPALHLAVLFCLTANDAPVRVVGSDGLATLLHQGRYDDALACELVAACIACGSVKPARLAASLAQVREAGEGEAIWPLVRAAVVAALTRDAAPAGTADLVELAIRLACDLGLKEQVPAVATAAGAAKGKPNKLQAQLLRLQAALAG